MLVFKRGLLVFVKAPVPGLVKTRLVPYLTAAKAANLAALLLKHTVDILGQIPNITLELHILGDSTHICFQSYIHHPNIIMHQQKGVDLSTRLCHAILAAFSHYQQVIILGTDCVVLTPDYLEKAFYQLQHRSPVVIGPALDGGYVLLGLNSPYLTLFKNIPWSTDQVLTVTRQRLLAEKLEWVELPRLWDIDTPKDLKKFQGWFLRNRQVIDRLSYPHRYHEIFSCLCN